MDYEDEKKLLEGLSPEVLAKLKPLLEQIVNKKENQIELAEQCVSRALGFNKGVNPIFHADMYKATHAAQIPEGTTFIQSYMEARSGDGLQNVVFFGLQFLLIELAKLTITQENVDEAEIVFAKTFFSSEIFNKAGWQKIVDNGGKLPIAIRALPEGIVVPRGTPLFTVETTNPEVPWIANWVETQILHVWHPITVASLAFKQRVELQSRILKEGFDADFANFMAKVSFIDFGMRGTTDLVACERAGAAVLTCFVGSDNTVGGMGLIQAYEGQDLPMESVFCSVPASEHMTMTIRGKSCEFESYANMLKVYPTGIVSVVSDSYDYNNAVENLWCSELKTLVLDRYEKAKAALPNLPHNVTIRPDSGDAITNIIFTLEKIAEVYGEKKSPNGNYRVVSDVFRVLQGDGINAESYPLLLDAIQEKGFSVTNIVAGSGGGLLQQLNRDTMRCAIKANCAIVDGEERQVNKETKGKVSKKGRLSVELENGVYKTYAEGKGNEDKNLLQLVFKDGVILRKATAKEVREKIDAAVQAEISRQ